MDRQPAPDQPVVRRDIVIHATPARVWPLLLQDSRATECGFGCRVETTGQVGTPVVERLATTGAVVARGKLLRHDPDSVLAFTIARPDHGGEEPGLISFELRPHPRAPSSACLWSTPRFNAPRPMNNSKA